MNNFINVEKILTTVVDNNFIDESKIIETSKQADTYYQSQEQFLDLDEYEQSTFLMTTMDNSPAYRANTKVSTMENNDEFETVTEVYDTLLNSSTPAVIVNTYKTKRKLKAEYTMFIRNVNSFNVINSKKEKIMSYMYIESVEECDNFYKISIIYKDAKGKNKNIFVFLSIDDFEYENTYSIFKQKGVIFDPVFQPVK